MASTVDQRTTGYPVTSGRTSLAAERAGIFVSLASNLQSCCQPNEGADAPPSAGHRHVGYKKHIEERLDLLRRLDWLETVAMLSGSAAVDPATPLRLSSTRTWPGVRHWTLRMPAWHTQERIARSTRRCCVCCSGTSPDKATYHEAAIRAAAVSRACPLWRSHMLPSCHL